MAKRPRDAAPPRRLVVVGQGGVATVVCTDESCAELEKRIDMEDALPETRTAASEAKFFQKILEVSGALFMRAADPSGEIMPGITTIQLTQSAPRQLQFRMPNAGQALHHVIRERAAAIPANCKKWMLQMFERLVRLHACFLIHGDIKIDNLCIDSAPHNNLWLIDTGKVAAVTSSPPKVGVEDCLKDKFSGHLASHNFPERFVGAECHQHQMRQLIRKLLKNPTPYLNTANWDAYELNKWYEDNIVRRYAEEQAAAPTDKLARIGEYADVFRAGVIMLILLTHIPQHAPCFRDLQVLAEQCLSPLHARPTAAYAWHYLRGDAGDVPASLSYRINPDEAKALVGRAVSTFCEAFKALSTLNLVLDPHNFAQVFFRPLKSFVKGVSLHFGKGWGEQVIQTSKQSIGRVADINSAWPPKATAARKHR